MTAGFTVTAGWDLPVGDHSQVHAAVALAGAAAAHARLVPADRAACELIATELATNLARHPRDGRLVATATDPGPCAWVQLTAVSHGPGVAGADVALAAGHSAADSLGGGLGACRRAAGAFDMYGAPGAGTVVVARVGAGSRLPAGSGGSSGSGVPGGAGGAPAVRVGGILSARPGERESGDGWGIWWDAEGLTVVILDGLGHGPEAAQACEAGLRSVAARAPGGPAGGPADLLTDLDRHLRGGRGAVGAVARLEHDQLHFGGIGNIGARLSGARRAQGLVSGMGTLGLGQRLRPVATTLPWGPASVFSAHTDGIRPVWDLSRYPGATRRDPAILAALIWRDAPAGAAGAPGRADDTAIVVVSGAAPEARAAAGPAPGARALAGPAPEARA
jgi:anti-sigma regulatory factor (Ser/Thr protein kinase)